MALQYIRAENNGKWYAVDLNDGNTLFHYKHRFIENPHRPWWQKAIFYDYDFIMRESKEGLHSVIFSFWDVGGNSFGCAACSMAKMWCVFPLDTSIEGNVWDEQTMLHKIFGLMVQRVPKPVRTAFAEEVKKRRGFDPYFIDSMREKAIRI